MKLKYRKKSTKTGKNFRGGGEEFFWLARIYTPAVLTLDCLKITKDHFQWQTFQDFR